jgi:hypothetical protein
MGLDESESLMKGTTDVIGEITVTRHFGASVGPRPLLANRNHHASHARRSGLRVDIDTFKISYR